MTKQLITKPAPADRASAVFWGILFLGLKGHEVELIIDGRENELPPERIQHAERTYAKIEKRWIKPE